MTLLCFLQYRFVYKVMSLQTLKVQEIDQGRIIRVTINRPKALNAMNLSFFKEITTTFQKINQHETVRAVLLEGQGRMFTAGLDLKQMGELFPSGDTQDPARTAFHLYNNIKILQQSFLTIYECRVPVIVGIHNQCIGGGIDMICTADIRYCTKDAQFSIKEIDIGMAADVGTLQLFPKRVGNHSTFRELAFTGKSINSEQAKNLGLISRIFQDKNALQAGLLQTARVIAAKSPVGIYTIKQVLLKGESRQIYQNLQYIARTNSVMLQTKDTMKSISAFLLKQKPQYPKL